jgi:hypothetical protein
MVAKTGLNGKWKKAEGLTTTLGVVFFEFELR